MNAARIHRFGSPDVIVVEDIPRPVPAMREVLVRVAASGVAPWDALIRQGKSKVSPQPPLTLGSDFAGVVETGDFADVARSVDVVIDTVGGDSRERAVTVLKRGGILVTVVSTDFVPARSDVRSAFFYAEVTTARLSTISRLLESGKVVPQVGSILPLADVRTAHEMLAGAPHQRGKIMLQIAS